MQIQRIGYGIGGFGRITDYAIRYFRMVTETAKKRAKILIFWQRHGLPATVEAFNVSRATLFAWRKQRKEGKGSLCSLNPKSRAPQRKRARSWPIEVIRSIKIIRAQHPNLGKEKIYPELKIYCDRAGFPCPSIATIGRLIADDPKKMRFFVKKPSAAGRRQQSRNRKTKFRKPKGYRASRPGECVAFDTIEKIIHGCRRYIITATEICARTGFGFATKSHASRETANLVSAILETFPAKTKFVLTDNGSEFMKCFQDELDRRGVTHWHTYPRTPKMNAHCERFNRTVQEEFVDQHLSLLADNLDAFNRKFADWLIWYNIERPHWSLGLKSPMQFILEKFPEESRIGWADT